MAKKWALWLHNHRLPRGLQYFTAGDKKWAWWLHTSCRLRAPQRFKAGGRGGQHWILKMSSDYITLDISGSPMLRR